MEDAHQLLESSIFLRKAAQVNGLCRSLLEEPESKENNASPVYPMFEAMPFLKHPLFMCQPLSHCSNGVEVDPPCSTISTSEGSVTIVATAIPAKRLLECIARSSSSELQESNDNKNVELHRNDIKRLFSGEGEVETHRDVQMLSNPSAASLSTSLAVYLDLFQCLML